MKTGFLGLIARSKASRKQARPTRQKRVAACELRFRELTLPATQAGTEPVRARGVYLVEGERPAGEEAMQWCLLTTRRR